jgi:small subunit ribosomal protein S2
MVDVIKEIKEELQEGVEAAEEIVEEVEEAAEEIVEDVENVAEKVKKKISKKKDEEKPEEKVDEKDAEKESTDEKVVVDIEAKKKAILAKAAKLKAKLGGASPSSEELKEQVKAKKKIDMLVPLEEYVKSGIYLGTRVVTPNMKPFVYRRRADGLAIFNTDLIDEKLKEGIAYLCKFEAKDIILVCKRQSGWKFAEKFSEITGIRLFAKKYPAGILTNTTLPDFFENELTVVTDSWIDKNALQDTLRVHKKVLMICDTNNFSKGADQIILGNNKSARSLGLIFYLLTRGYCKAKGIDADIPDMEWWTGE